MVKEREEELTKKTLVSLNEMRIKFPGKSDIEAEYLLDQVSRQIIVESRGMVPHDIYFIRNSHAFFSMACNTEIVFFSL